MKYFKSIMEVNDIFLTDEEKAKMATNVGVLGGGSAARRRLVSASSVYMASTQEIHEEALP